MTFPKPMQLIVKTMTAKFCARHFTNVAHVAPQTKSADMTVKI
jgi:hypothetical protein